MPEESKQDITGEVSGRNRQQKTKVPPIMVNQINKLTVNPMTVVRPDNPQSFTNTASSQVLNNFFNMPHGKHNTQSAFASGHTSGP